MLHHCFQALLATECMKIASCWVLTDFSCHGRFECKTVRWILSSVGVEAWSPQEATGNRAASERDLAGRGFIIQDYTIISSSILFFVSSID